MLNKLYKILFTLTVLLSVFLVSYSLTACASMLTYNFKVVDKELQKYVDEYYELLDRYCYNGNYNKTTNYRIHIEDSLDDNTWIGVCRYKLNGFHIAIRKSWWDKSSDKDRRQLMYHELTHCVLDVNEHVDERRGPHYMNPSFGSIPVKMLMDQVSEDIFNKCT